MPRPTQERTLELWLEPDAFAICRLAPDAPLPAWAIEGPWFSVTRTAQELSIVCLASRAPRPSDLVRVDEPWRMLSVSAPPEIGLSGVLRDLSGVLARVGVPLFALSTFDTDVLLVAGARLEQAVRALSADGHTLRRSRRRAGRRGAPPAASAVPTVVDTEVAASSGASVPTATSPPAPQSTTTPTSSAGTQTGSTDLRAGAPPSADASGPAPSPTPAPAAASGREAPFVALLRGDDRGEERPRMVDVTRSRTPEAEHDALRQLEHLGPEVLEAAAQLLARRSQGRPEAFVPDDPEPPVFALAPREPAREDAGSPVGASSGPSTSAVASAAMPPSTDAASAELLDPTDPADDVPETPRRPDPPTPPTAATTDASADPAPESLAAIAAQVEPDPHVRRSLPVRRSEDALDAPSADERAVVDAARADGLRRQLIEGGFVADDAVDDALVDAVVAQLDARAGRRGEPAATVEFLPDEGGDALDEAAAPAGTDAGDPASGDDRALGDPDASGASDPAEERERHVERVWRSHVEATMPVEDDDVRLHVVDPDDEW